MKNYSSTRKELLNYADIFHCTTSEIYLYIFYKKEKSCITHRLRKAYQHYKIIVKIFFLCTMKISNNLENTLHG